MKKKRLLLLTGLLLGLAIASNVYGQQDPLTENTRFSDATSEMLALSSHFVKTNHKANRKIKVENENGAMLEGPKKLEFAAWYGVTFGDNENQNGIRRLDVKYEPNAGNQLFIFYDNALAFDNITIARTERLAPIVGIGAKHDWSKEWFTKLELGRRFLTTQDDQELINMENGYFFSSKFLAKLITQYDIRQDDNLLTLGAFIDFQVLDKFRIETGLFHAENLTFNDTFNERFMIIPKLRFGKTELVLGAYYDRYRTVDTSLDQFSGGYSLFIFPLAGDLRGNLFFNYDKGFRNEITVFSLGLNQKI
jgi:hypothetical protein